MKLCLDTDVAIDLIRGVRPHYRVLLQEAQVDRWTARPCSAATVGNCRPIGALAH